VLRITVFVAAVSLLAVSCQPSADYADVFNGTGGRWIDLTYSFSEDAIYWPTGKPFTLEQEAYGITEKGYFYASYNYSAAEHGGTHFDAPIHFAEGAQTAEQVPLDKLIGPAVVVDVSDRADADYQVRVSDLEEWESLHGEIPVGAIVLFRTGLVDKGSVDAIGIDTPSIDYGQSSDFETHVIVYGANIPGFENLANLHQLPESGAFLVALPMKIEGGSGGPLRVAAFVPGG
jgi:kynurenine formamidase